MTIETWFAQGPHRARLAVQEPTETSPPAYGDYARRWLSDKEPRISAGTAYDWRRIVEGRLISRFGAMSVSAITEEAIEAFVAGLKRVPVQASGPRPHPKPGRGAGAVSAVMGTGWAPHMRKGLRPLPVTP